MLVSLHPFNQSGANNTNWTAYEHQLCTSPAYIERLCSVCNTSGFGQTDIFSCDPCLGIDEQGVGVVNTTGIFAMWGCYALAFLVY